MTLEERYNKLCATPSSVNEHLPTLRRYAEMSESVAEFGVDIGQSTTAFLMAQPNRLLSVDVVYHDGLTELYDLVGGAYRYKKPDYFIRCGKTEWNLRVADSRTTTIPAVDLLFIDSAHCYDVIKVELERHASNVRRWIICHDIVTFGQWGEAGEPQVGIGPAIAEFLAAHPEWRERERFEFNNGLLVMERVS